MSFIGSDDLFSLAVHAIHIVFVSVVELIHLPDKVVPFVCESTKIIFKPALLALRIQSSFSHHLKLTIQVSQSMAIALVFSLQLPQFVILTKEISIQLICFS